MLGQIDHIGVAVEDLDAAVALYGDRLGIREHHRETIERQGVHVALMEIGVSNIELLSPIGPEGPVARFLERRGPGLHHVAYRTEDIDSELERLRGAGLRVIDEEPHIGIQGSRVAFVHPKSIGGVLTEIVEPAVAHAPAGGR